MQQTACQVFNPMMVDSYAALFGSMGVVYDKVLRLNDGFDILRLDDSTHRGSTASGFL